MASVDEVVCKDEHILALYIMNQRNADVVIHAYGLLSFDHIKCSKCHTKFHHVTYCFACEKCNDYFLCFKCYPYPINRLNESSIITWYLNTNDGYTSIALKTTDIDRHRDFVDNHAEKHVSEEFRFFGFNVMFTTPVSGYIKHLSTGEVPENPLIKKAIDAQNGDDH